MWILLCNAAISQCFPRCYSNSEKRKISRIFWLDMPVVSLQILIQYIIMKRRSAALRGKRVVKKSSPHEVKDLLFSSPSFVLLRGLGRCALRLAVLGGGGFAAPGSVVAQSRGAGEVVLVVQAVGGVVLRILQTSDQTLILVPELAAHQGRLANHHHVLERGRGRGRASLQTEK